MILSHDVLLDYPRHTLIRECGRLKIVKNDSFPFIYICSCDDLGEQKLPQNVLRLLALLLLSSFKATLLVVREASTTNWVVPRSA